MALRVEYRGMTSDPKTKPNMCMTCRERKEGIFTVDAYMRPMCYDCAVAAKRIIPHG